MSDFVYVALTLLSFAGLALLVGVLDSRLTTETDPDPDPAVAIAPDAEPDAEPAPGVASTEAVRR